jgi:hypothetical protein
MLSFITHVCWIGLLVLSLVESQGLDFFVVEVLAKISEKINSLMVIKRKKRGFDSYRFDFGCEFNVYEILNIMSALKLILVLKKNLT